MAKFHRNVELLAALMEEIEEEEGDAERRGRDVEVGRGRMKEKGKGGPVTLQMCPSLFLPFYFYPKLLRIRYF